MCCSCGKVETHAIANRETADGFRLRVWSDGALTHATPGDPFVRGIGRSRFRWSRSRDVAVVSDICDDIPIFELSELPTLISVARAAQKHSWRSDSERRAHIREKALRVLARKT